MTIDGATASALIGLGGTLIGASIALSGVWLTLQESRKAQAADGRRRDIERWLPKLDRNLTGTLIHIAQITQAESYHGEARARLAAMQQQLQAAASALSLFESQRQELLRSGDEGDDIGASLKILGQRIAASQARRLELEPQLKETRRECRKLIKKASRIQRRLERNVQELREDALWTALIPTCLQPALLKLFDCLEEARQKRDPGKVINARADLKAALERYIVGELR